jgi:predicted phosphodiesterase
MSVYAVADLHGQLELWEQISKFLKEDDTIYVLGDCGDRGLQPWETIKAVYRDPRVIYIKGNHEDMLVKAMREWHDYETWHSDAIDLLYYNGGAETFDGWHHDGSKMEWATRLSALPMYAKYINQDGVEIHMTHSGSVELCEQDCLWDRTHFNEDWLGEEHQLIIHGHTNVAHVWKALGFPQDNKPSMGKAYWYCDGNKVCLDVGSYISNIAIVLNLDTFEEYKFEIERKEENENGNGKNEQI